MTDHKAEAIANLETAKQAPQHLMTETYLRAAGVHATLALVEQQQIANQIALEALYAGRIRDDAGIEYHPLRSWMPNERINAIDEALGTFS